MDVNYIASGNIESTTFNDKKVLKLAVIIAIGIFGATLGMWLPKMV